MDEPYSCDAPPQTRDMCCVTAKMKGLAINALLDAISRSLNPESRLAILEHIHASCALACKFLRTITLCLLRRVDGISQENAFKKTLMILFTTLKPYLSRKSGVHADDDENMTHRKLLEQQHDL